jgi:hypothetical protein
MEVTPGNSGQDLSAFKRTSSFESRKHLSPIDLENIVKSVTENSELLELPPLPPSLVPAEVSEASKGKEETSVTDIIPDNDSIQSLSKHVHDLTLVPELSTSTFDTTAVGSECSQQSSNRQEPLASSVPTEITGMSIVHGFSRENISRSRRSTTQLAHTPTPSLRVPPTMQPPQASSFSGRRPSKKAVFMLGTSEGEDSVSDHSNGWIHKQHHMAGPSNYRQNQTLQNEMQNHMPEDAIEDSDEEEEEDDEDWEDDEPSEAAQPTVEEEGRFQRVSSTSNLTSRRSLITTMMHEKDRATAILNVVSQSTPAIRRSRSHISGPVISENHIQPSRAQPMAIPQQLSQAEPAPLLSPRTNRRNMLSTELTGSLRKHLLWERQQRNPASKLLKNRQFRSDTRLAEVAKQDNPHLPFLADNGRDGGESSKTGAKPDLVRNDSRFFDNGALEYYDKGW